MRAARPPSTDGFETPSLRPLLEERWHSPATTLIMDVVSFNLLILEITPHMSESYSFFWQQINVDDIWLADDLRLNKSSQ